MQNQFSLVMVFRLTCGIVHLPEPGLPSVSVICSTVRTKTDRTAVLSVSDEQLFIQLKQTDRWQFANIRIEFVRNTEYNQCRRPQGGGLLCPNFRN